MGRKHHEDNLNLQRGVRKETDEVILGLLLDGHKIKHTDTQRTNPLHICSIIVHYEDVLLLERFDGWEILGKS
jgi:hypothetical protein